MITKQNHTGSYRAIVLAAALVCAGGGLTAAESPAPPEPPKGWETTAAAALTLTRGNSETFLATLSLDTKRKWEKDEAALGISGGYGESKVNDVNTKNTEFLQGYGQYNRLFTERFYGAPMPTEQCPIMKATNLPSRRWPPRLPAVVLWNGTAPPTCDTTCSPARR